MDRLHRAGDRVGNVVEFQIEEDRQAHLCDLVHAVVPVLAEKLEAQLQAADMALHLFGKSTCCIETRQIEGEIDWVAHVVADLS